MIRYRGRGRAQLATMFALAMSWSAAIAQERPAASVQVAHARVKQLAPTVHAAGIVRSRSAADLAASVGGRLQWVAEPGTAVAAGAPVARLDTRELALARAEQAARVNRAAVNLKALDRKFDRLRASGNAVSRFNVDQAQSNRDLAAADLEVARALLAQTDDQLARSRLTAPFADVVSNRVRRAGEEVARGEIVASIVNPDELEIRLSVPLRHVRAIQPGHVVNVASEGRPFTAAVSRIVPAGEPQRRLAVPRDALIIRAEGLYVYKVNSAQQAERVEVKAGVADGDWIGVEGKLAPGDQVIVRGGELLRGNDKVQVVGIFEEEEPPVRSAERPRG